MPLEGLALAGIHLVLVLGRVSGTELAPTRLRGVVLPGVVMDGGSAILLAAAPLLGRKIRHHIWAQAECLPPAPYLICIRSWAVALASALTAWEC